MLEHALADLLVAEEGAMLGVQVLGNPALVTVRDL
jgi:hypothetical protein